MKTPDSSPSFFRTILKTFVPIVGVLLLAGCTNSSKDRLVIDCSENSVSREGGALISDFKVGDEFWLQRTTDFLGGDGVKFWLMDDGKRLFNYSASGGTDIDEIDGQNFTVRMPRPIFASQIDQGVNYTVTLKIEDGEAALLAQGYCR
jgi:hypothetical protein